MIARFVGTSVAIVHLPKRGDASPLPEETLISALGVEDFYPSAAKMHGSCGCVPASFLRYSSAGSAVCQLPGEPVSAAGGCISHARYLLESRRSCSHTFSRRLIFPAGICCSAADTSEETSLSDLGGRSATFTSICNQTLHARMSPVALTLAFCEALLLSM